MTATGRACAAAAAHAWACPAAALLENSLNLFLPNTIFSSAEAAADAADGAIAAFVSTSAAIIGKLAFVNQAEEELRAEKAINMATNFVTNVIPVLRLPDGVSAKSIFDAKFSAILDAEKAKLTVGYVGGAPVPVALGTSCRSFPLDQLLQPSVVSIPFARRKVTATRRR